MSKSKSSGLDRLSRMAENAVGDDPRAVTFTRGLMLGALVGAAIAGSTLWQRRHARQDRAAAAEPARDDATRDEADRLTAT